MRKADVVFGIFLVCAIVFMVISPMVILPKIYGVSNIWNKDLPKNTTFVELWQVDTFEGGSASRSRYLEKTAFKFQELNSNVYIFVRTLNIEQLKYMLSVGKKPDMISFGVGAGELLYGYCRELDIKTPVRAELMASGMVAGKQLAIPWCMGGYILASTLDVDMVNLPNEPMGGYRAVLGYGQDANVTSNVLSELNCVSISEDKMDAYEAYKNFVVGKNYNVLLGTQRDYHRLQNKVNLGVISNCNYRYLSGYNDLVQYIAITGEDEGVVNCAKNFVRYLTSVTVQKTLTQIGMFGVSAIKIYNDGMTEFENSVMSTKNILNVFVSDAELDVMREGR